LDRFVRSSLQTQPSNEKHAKVLDFNTFMLFNCGQAALPAAPHPPLRPGVFDALAKPVSMRFAGGR
jgi:hypothetical protein